MATRALLVLLLSWCCATADYFVSSNLHPRFDNHPETVENQLRVVDGGPMYLSGIPFDAPQFQSRVMFPLALSALVRLGFPASPAFIVLRFLTAWIAFAAFLMVALTAARANLKTAGMGAMMLAYGLIFTFNFGWEHPTDFLDVAFTALFVGLALRQQRALLFVAALVATLNHQTAAFAAVIWLCLWGRAKPVREGLYAAALVVASYGVSTVVKMYFGRSAATQSLSYIVDGWRTIGHFKYAIRHLTPTAWPLLLVAMWLPMAGWLAINRRGLVGSARGLLVAAVAMIAIGTPIAFWSEIRSVFLMPFVIATFAATMAETRATAP